MDRLTQYKIKRGLAVFLIVTAIVLTVLFAGAGILFGINRFSLSVQLEGDGEVVLEYGQPYEELGGEARIFGSLFFRSGFPVDAEVTTEGTVNTDALGIYTVTYRTSWAFWDAETTRTVRVVDKKAPIITLNTIEDRFTIIGEPYEEEGYTAVDEYDGDITHRVTAVEADGVVTYRVSDDSGNETVVQRQIRYYDPIVPNITLSGGAITVFAGEDYAEPGYSAWDNGDGDITDRVEVSTNLIKYLAGTYQVTYTVTDSHGNTTSVSRDILVEPKSRPESVLPEGKIIYLTFDDGPSEHTRQLLEILQRNGVQATFFVCDTEHIDVLPEIIAQGHSIAVHSETHNYRKIYASVDAYFDDMLWMRRRIYETTGVETNLIRFPGGGSNTVSKFNPGIMTTLTQAVQDCGYTYFDWNVDSNDAGGAQTSDEVFTNVTEGIEWAMDYYGFALVLQHDTQEFSIQAVERIIQWGKENGFTFMPLENNSPTIHHYLNN